MNRESVALLLGVAAGTVTQWEGNVYQPFIQVRPRIVEFLGYEPELPHYPVSPGERLRLHRRARGLRQIDLAKQLGIGQERLSAWEQGKRRISPDIAERLHLWYSE